MGVGDCWNGKKFTWIEQEEAAFIFQACSSADCLEKKIIHGNLDHELREDLKWVGLMSQSHGLEDHLTGY